MSSIIRSGKLWTAVSAAVLGFTVVLPVSRGDEAKAPATQPVASATPTKAEKEKQLKSLFEQNQKLSERITEGLGAAKKPIELSKTLADTAKRDAAAATVIPLVNERMTTVEKMADLKLLQPEQIEQMRQLNIGMLYALNDPATKTRVDEMSKRTVKADKVDGQSTVFYAQWLAAIDAKAQSDLVEKVEAFADDYRDQSRVTGLILTMLPRAMSQQVHDGLMGILTNTMTDPTAVKVKAQMAAQKKMMEEAEAKLKTLEGKPLTVAAKTVDGKPFSSDEYKGKVVLVDFWATWCVPCKAALPHVKEIYSKYHDKGLEIVGVSCDVEKKALVEFTPKNGMPWVQLFDPSNAAEHKWHPLAEQYGVMGIPRMFLIDKKGVCRTVEANDKLDELIPKLLAE